MSATVQMIEHITRRIPSLHASVVRVSGAEAFLFGIDFALSDWAELCDEADVHEYERGQPLFWDGLKLQRSTTLEAGQINAVVFVPNQLIVRPTTLAVPAAA